MNTKSKLLKKTAQAVMIVALLYVAGMQSALQAQSAWEQTQNYLFYLVYADYQVCEQLMPERENGKPDAIRRNLLPVDEGSMLAWIWDEENNPGARKTGLIGLAKNETEGFQVFFREQEKVRNLRIEVSPFLNTQNEELQHTVYYEEFFYLTPQPELTPPDSLAEALVPYFSNQVKPTSVGHNVVFYVELQSLKNQTPGNYVSTITAYDGDAVIDTRTVTAKVWNFALPEGHYSEVVMGLYNRNSGYRSTSSFLTLNGIQVDSTGNVVSEDLEEAKRILDGYQDCLLEHGVSTYEIPRWLMDDDPKAAELTMADPRRKVFEVPVHWGDLNGSSFNGWGQSVLQQYKDIVYDNPLLKDKAFFYPMDEPKWNNQEIVDRFNNVCAALSESWPGYHAVIPFTSDYSSTVERFEGKIDILCPNQDAFNPAGGISGAEDRLQDFMTRSHTWRYQGDGQCGGIYGFIHAIAPVGTMRRSLFWQQYVINSDGFLNWNCAYLPDDWVKKTLPAASGIQTGNGDGILLYPGAMFGQDATTPVVSLRLKQLAEGIDDYDYLCLAKEFISPDYVINILKSGVTPSEALAVFYHYTQLDYLCKIINRQWDIYRAWSCRFINITRHYIGNALDAANTEHTWGEWQTAVLPDDTHNGLEIRTCSHCGAQESREKTFLHRFVGTEDNQWANLNNWEGCPETLPASGEAVVIAHDCEIDTNTTVFNVIVNDGFNLTIHDGAILTSSRMATEGDAQVVIEDGAQLYTHSEGVQATMKKNIAPHGDTDGWYFISTSLATEVEPSTSNGIVPSTEDGYDLYYFDQSESLEWRNYKDNGFDLENGEGYLYANQAETILNFTGQLNPCNVEINIPITYSNSPLTGLNLVGNPFPCNAYLMDENHEIMPFYRMNEEGDTIVATQAGMPIKPCEGVFVFCPNDRQAHSVVFTTIAPANIGEAQDVPNMLLPIHDLLINQDACGASSSITQTVELSAGTNWFSTNVEVTLDHLKAALVAAAPGTTITIQSQTLNTSYNPNNGRWTGQLTTLDVTRMYVITVATDCEIVLEGMLVDLAGHPVTIASGANWIAYPLDESMSLTDAFAGFAVNGDVVQSQTTNASYIRNRWQGQLTELVPGKGYIYNSSTSESRVFTFPVGAK